ncbi:hypothetical protein D9V37_01680 [Nocardioides mangrovicus]|uniref:YCII-related domain-containing protein n=1 Tax=Nocardioides mangrovicus TaxID=2478913 RepID=A0A3L8P6I6_9ACTN|nr:YciI family protein [Nocardioides mangrovicus]RLV50704.1 hypothetical protein D9V37_01680 [Nocardioides mangrovicus]
MAEWVYLLHPPRENFIATLSESEREVFGRHAQYQAELLEAGTLLLSGPTFGPENTGICVFTADDEAAARAVMEADPAVSSGVMRGDLRLMGVLRGR